MGHAVSRTPAVALEGALAVQPSGWALPNDPESTWGKFLAPWADAEAGVEASMESMLVQTDPRAAVALLPDWEAMLGPDPCGRVGITLGDRQTLAYQRLTSRGGQSPAYFVALAATMGVAITIREGGWSRAGQLRAGRPVCAPGNQFNWQVTLPATLVTKFRAGGAVAGNRLGAFARNLVECPITHAAPAASHVSFTYLGLLMALEDDTGNLLLEDESGVIALEN